MPPFLTTLRTRATAVATAGYDRWPALAHLWDAARRYSACNAGRLAAASAYYGFFAIFATGVVGFAVLGQIFQDNETVTDAVSEYLSANLPQVQTEDLVEGGARAGVVALCGLLVAGVAWVENLRSSQRAVWRLDQQPGNPILRWLVDLAVLAGLGVLILVSISVYSGLRELLLWLAGDSARGLVGAMVGISNLALGGLVDLVLGSALLAGVPRLRLSPRRLLPSSVLFVVGMGLLKTVGNLYVARTQHNPAYQFVAGTVGLLLSLYLLHQMLLFAAALAATGKHGRVADLAGRRPGRELEAVTAADRTVAALTATAELAERAARAAAETRRERFGPRDQQR